MFPPGWAIKVLKKEVYASDRTFRWMKRYISMRSAVKRRDGRELSPYDAGRDFLSLVLAVALETERVGDEEVAFTVPVESFEHYENWLTEVAAAAGISRFRLIDESSAVALGYGAHVQPGQAYLIIDFGGGTLDVAVVRIEEGERNGSGPFFSPPIRQRSRAMRASTWSSASTATSGCSSPRATWSRTS